MKKLILTACFFATSMLAGTTVFASGIPIPPPPPPASTPIAAPAQPAPAAPVAPTTTAPTPVNIFYQNRTTTQPSRGVVFERNRMMTERGMLDVHVITVDLNEPYITARPIVSQGNLGRKETTANLVREAGAVAGINADFFGLQGAYSVHFGPMVVDGELLGFNTYTNHTYNQFASFMLDMDNNPIFDYLRSSIRFYNNGRSNIEINAYNSIGNTLDWALIVDRNAMYNTAQISERFEGLSKVVVEGNQIIYVSEQDNAGPVDIPLHGYVLVLPQAWGYRIERFNVGDITRLVRSNSLNIDYSQMQAVVGGGGLILQDGRLVNDRGIAPAGRHPRSAIGTSRDGSQLILMTVDGRSHSIGATHGEMGYLLRMYGAYNAMHFDGGGSTTLVTSERGSNHTVANTVSDGHQRRVINAFGIFDNAPLGEEATLVLEIAQAQAAVGSPVDVRAYFEDEFWNLTPVVGGVFTTTDTDTGHFEDGQFIPTRPGRHVVQVAYDGQVAEAVIHAYPLAQLVANRSAINLFEGGRVSLSFNGVTAGGNTVPISSFDSVHVSPSTLGRFENGYFVAGQGGSGYVAVRVDDVRVFVPVSINGFPRAVAMEGVGALAVPRTTPVTVAETGRGISMSYSFGVSSNTQAAYVTFYPALEIPGRPLGLRVEVYGDNSSHWLRGRITDAEGENHLIDFTRAVDFVGWQHVTAQLPAGLEFPITIDQIYMVQQSNYEASQHQVYFRNLAGLYAPPTAAAVPESTRFADRAHRPSDLGSGAQGFNIPTGEDNAYSVEDRGNFTAVTLTASEGGLFATDAAQWRRLMRDIRQADNDYVLLLMDRNPANFTQSMEFELLHLAMVELVQEGRTVFVAHAAGDRVSVTIRDGVRYITMPEENPMIRLLPGGEDHGVIWG